MKLQEHRTIRPQRRGQESLPRGPQVRTLLSAIQPQRSEDQDRDTQAMPCPHIRAQIVLCCLLIMMALLISPSWPHARAFASAAIQRGSVTPNGRYGNGRTPSRSGPPPFWSRFPIRCPRGRRLRVLCYARYSTEEQDPRSIEDQVAYCRRFLGTFGLRDEDLEITVIYDREISGEVIFRPGIDQVRAGLEIRAWDLIVVEDASRLFRDVAACIELVRIAVDQGIRVVAINDEVDTDDEENWEDRLYEAARHHARTNRDTSKRIKRTHEALFEMGAAIGKLKPGYLRVPFYEDKQSDPHFGPFRDKLDPQWQAVMHEAYERIAREDPPWLVGQFLTERGFPKASGSCSAEYTDKNVVAFIRRDDHRGVQRFRITVSKKILRKGKRKAERNPDPEKVLMRQMPELRVVPDALWLRANDVITERRKCRKAPATGRDHPLAGIVRDSRGPLSGVFVCGCCTKKAKMNVDGRGGDGYRCRGVRKRKCWNKATAIVKLTHQRIAGAICDQLRMLDTELDGLLSHVRDIFDDHGLRQGKRDQYEQAAREAAEALDNLGKVAEKAQELPDKILERMNYWQDLSDRARADLEYLARQEQLMAVPTRAQLEERIEKLLLQLQEMKRTVRSELKTLVGRIEAVPYRQFGSKKIVLRARFELKLAGLLPDQIRATLTARFNASIDNRFGTIPMLVDLFNPSTGPKHGREALRLAEEEELDPTAIGHRLKITKRRANIAIQYGKAMRAEGVTDPFSEVTEDPGDASRWRPPGHRSAQQKSSS